MKAYAQEIALLETALAASAVSPSERADSRKWLRFYLDFCEKYGHAPAATGSLPLFLAKLRQKGQNENRRQQARQTLDLYLNNVHQSTVLSSEIVARQDTPQPPRGEAVGPDRPADWDGAIALLVTQLKLKHRARNTIDTYLHWSRCFQRYLSRKPVGLVDTADVRGYLEHLAVKCNVAASTQNQAFNALLSFFRHGLNTEPGDLKGIPRARVSRYIPTVLSRQEITDVIERLCHPHRLVAELLYGCGLRVNEGVSLRVGNFDLDGGMLTIRRGKGSKDRTVPLPEKTLPSLRAQLKRVTALHAADVKARYDGTFLPDALERKFPGHAKDLVWYWMFPAYHLVTVPETGERRRYHLHDTAFGRALRAAVRAAGIPKRVTAHTLRHSYATHMLQARYDIRTIQELLGHSDIRTTMIYTHVLKPEHKEIKSPLDFD
jgi:integron integrase